MKSKRSPAFGSYADTGEPLIDVRNYTQALVDKMTTTSTHAQAFTPSSEKTDFVAAMTDQYPTVSGEAVALLRDMGRLVMPTADYPEQQYMSVAGERVSVTAAAAITRAAVEAQPTASIEVS